MYSPHLYLLTTNNRSQWSREEENGPEYFRVQSCSPECHNKLVQNYRFDVMHRSTFTLPNVHRPMQDQRKKETNYIW